MSDDESVYRTVLLDVRRPHISSQAMWAEVIKKENATIGEPHRFFLNPNKLVFIARKPTEVDPRTYEADALIAAGSQVQKELLPETSRPLACFASDGNLTF